MDERDDSRVDDMWMLVELSSAKCAGSWMIVDDMCGDMDEQNLIQWRYVIEEFPFSPTRV